MRKNTPTYDTTDYFQVYSSDNHLPEKRLLFAVIQRALADYSMPEAKHPLLRGDAGAWLFSDSREVMSLRWICNMLSDNPSWLRGVILDAARNKTWRHKAVIFRVDRR